MTDTIISQSIELSPLITLYTAVEQLLFFLTKLREPQRLKYYLLVIATLT